MPEENTLMKREQDNREAIIGMSKDISYIKDAVRDIQETLKIYNNNFATKIELKDVEKKITDRIIENEKTAEAFITKTEFDPIKSTLVKINWLVISIIIVAIMSFIIKSVNSEKAVKEANKETATWYNTSGLL